MRTNIVIDDELMTEAIRASGLTTKRDVVEPSLREFIRSRDQSWIFGNSGTNPDFEVPGHSDAERGR